MDILLSNDDLTVFGGPESISLDLDIGPQGDRGSIIVGSNGNPQDVNVDAELRLQPRYLPPAPGFDFPDGINALDIAIDYNPYSPTYKTIFQRVATPTGTQWTEMLSLKTNFYSSVKDVTAVAGSDGIGTITIPPINITEIASDINLTSANFSIQYSVSSNGGPLATNLVVGEVLDNPPIRALPLEIKGVEYDGTTWVPMAGPRRVHLFITVV
jgi:hypothetical protein